MAEYIDRGKILELISCEMEKQKREYAFSDGVHCGLERALGIVEDCPTADVAQVAHGWWIFNDDWWDFRCSLCGSHVGNIKKLNYCPNCGAKMDKE